MKPTAEEKNKLPTIRKTNIRPTQINKKIEDTLTKSDVSSYHYDNAKQKAAEQDLQYLPKEEIEKRIREKRKLMESRRKSL